MATAIVLGAGGFIGNHLVSRLKEEGYYVRGVDLKYPEFDETKADEFLIIDLRNPRNVEACMRLEYINERPVPFSQSITAFAEKRTFDEVYQLAADMGGAGYIFTGDHDADIMNNSALINLNVAAWAQMYGVGKLFYSSSACMYPQELQQSGKPTVPGYPEEFGLKESDAYPANPDSEYGWEKLFSERLFLAYARNYGLNVRIARFHNIFGPGSVFEGGKEKAPAAICRKVITRDGNSIEIWGDGEQTRSFLYIDDCIDAVRLLMQSDFKEPINIGSDVMVSINQLADMAIEFSEKQITKVYDTTKPQGVRGRNSDNTLIHEVLKWEPKVTLWDGLQKTYWWIAQQYINKTAKENAN